MKRPTNKILKLIFGFFFLLANPINCIAMSIELVKVGFIAACNVIGLLSIVITQIPIADEKYFPGRSLSQFEKTALIEYSEQQLKALEIHDKLQPLLAETPYLEKSQELDLLLKSAHSVAKNQSTANAPSNNLELQNQSTATTKIGFNYQHSIAPIQPSQIPSHQTSQELEQRALFSMSQHWEAEKIKQSGNFNNTGQAFDSLCQQDDIKALKVNHLKELLNNEELCNELLPYIEELEQLFTHAANYSSDIKSLEAQLQLLKERTALPGFLNVYTHQAEELLLNILVDNQGNFKGIFNQKDFENAQEAICNFKAMTQELKPVLRDVINKIPRNFDAEKIIKIAPNPQGIIKSWGHGISSMVGKKLQPYQLREKFLNKEKNHLLIKTVKLTNQKDLLKAQNALRQLTNSLSSKHKADFSVRETVARHLEQEFSKYYDEYGIKKIYALDPVREKFVELIQDAKTTTEKINLQELAEKQLCARNIYHDKILDRLSLKDTLPEAVHEYVYKIIPIWADASKVREFLCTLNVDSLNPAQQIAYPYFFDENGLIKLYDHKQENLLGVSFPDAIHSREYQDVRLLVNKFANIVQNTEQTKEQIRRGLLDLKTSLEDPLLAQKTKYLSQLRFDALLDKGKDQTILQLGNFSSYDDQYYTLINNQLADLAIATLKKAQQTTDPSAYVTITKTIHHINRAQQVLEEGSTCVPFWDLSTPSQDDWRVAKALTALYAAQKLLNTETPPPFNENPKNLVICPQPNLEENELDHTGACGNTDLIETDKDKPSVCPPGALPKNPRESCNSSQGDLPPFGEEKEEVDLKDVIEKALESNDGKVTIQVNGKEVTIKMPKNLSPEALKALENFNIDDYPLNPEDKEILEEAVKHLKNIPGALSRDGPLAKVLELGKENKEKKRGTIRGALYELEKALELIKKGETILALGLKINDGTSFRDFDIVTNNKLIECKNINWNLQDVSKQSIFIQQKIITEILIKEFEIHSNRIISSKWKSWFAQKNIKYYEGSL